MNSLLIWGAVGHAREVHWLCELLGREVVGFLDERPTMRGSTLLGLPVHNSLYEIMQMRHEVEVVCAGVGDPPLGKVLAADARGGVHHRWAAHSSFCRGIAPQPY